MSVSGVLTVPGEPEWIEGKSLTELGAMLSKAQIHLMSYHRRNRSAAQLTDLMGALMLAYLAGSTSPQAWRPSIVDDMRAAPYIKGCCAWRD